MGINEGKERKRRREGTKGGEEREAKKGRELHTHRNFQKSAPMLYICIASLLVSPLTRTNPAQHAFSSTVSFHSVELIVSKQPPRVQQMK